MKSKNNLFQCFLVLCVWIAIAGCGPSRPKIFKVDPAFGEYISAYTSGMIHRKSNIRIELAEAPVLSQKGTDAGALPDSSLLKNIFSFKPEVKGRAIWISDRIIEFIPDEPLPVDQFYTVDFDLEKVARVKNNYENFKLQMSTYQQNMFVSVRGLHNMDDYNIEWQRLEGRITLSDDEDTSLIRQTLSITQNGKKIPFHLEQSYYETNEYHFYADSIERKSTTGKVVVAWNGKPIHSMSKGKEEIEVSALGDFTVTNAKVVDNGDQYVELYFSEPIAYNQDLNGIISIQGIDKLNYKIEYNMVTVYLQNRSLGDRMLSVSNGIKNIKGHKMLEAYSSNLVFEEPKPLIRIKGKGSVLPNSNGLIFPFESISLKAVDVRVIKIFENNIHHFLQINDLDGEDGLTRFGKVIAEKTIQLNLEKNANLSQWSKHVIDLGKLIKPDPGAIYRVSIKFRKEYAVCDCPVTDSENTASEEPEEKNDWNERNWHGYGFDGGYDTWSYYNEDYSPCDDYYYQGKAVSRNILASDLGMIFKLDENKLSHAFISNMITTEPVANAEVKYYDFTKQVIASGTTDNNGMLDVHLKEKPFLMIAKSGNQRGYLKLLDGHTNSLSKFDVEGEVVQKGVKGFIYGERGVWRPGDSLYLTFILENKDKSLPPGHPVKFELQDPGGQAVYQVTKTKHINGMYDFRTQTSPEAPTGNYTAVVKVGNRVFSKSLKIETVKPNRLKIYMNIDPDQSDSTSMLAVKWLHGAVAKKLRASVNVTLTQAKTSFDKYKNYEFDSPVRAYGSEVEALLDGNLDEKGEAKIKTKLNVGKNAPGKLRATYITKVFEQGGDFSIDRNSVTYSPFETYVGLQTPDVKNYDNTLETGHNYRFDVVTLSAKGNLVNTEKLQVKVYKMQWRWWYEKDQEDLSNYMARTGTVVVQDTLITAKSGKSSFNFKVNYPEYGRYLVTVTDLAGNHQTGKIVYIDWPYWSRANRNNNENASMLNFACDKEKYTKGENIKLSFPSASDGRALVSVETRSKVIKKFWIRTNKGETVHEFQATADMSPNAYIHVTLIQPHASTKNDLPIRMYGVVPVTVDDPATHLNPQIKMPDALKPESVANIRVSEQNGRKMTYTLALVDEGLLDLTGYKTPQPWNTFYAREALGVKTWDMYDHVIGAYAGKLDKLLSIGGDGNANMGKGAKANRFKPVVQYLGPFTLEPGQEKSHRVEIPNYVGSVKVMVVAQNDGAYGSTEKVVAVKKPLMVLATLPRVLGPDEQVYLPVNVFAMEKHVKDVKVKIEVNEFLTIEGNKQESLQFAQIGDEVVNFRLKVAPRIGIARVKITATCGNETAVQEIELDVRTPNPKVTDGESLLLEAGKEAGALLDFKGLTGTNKATIEFSAIPSMGLEKRLDYLIQYPHGCIEQTTSGVFPQLYVSNLLELNEKQKNKISENIRAGLKRLQLFQTSGGGLAYWPGESNGSEWGTNYAGHFFLEAEKQGYSLPGNLKARWVKFQQQAARNWSNEGTRYQRGNQASEMIQAYRLFVLALSQNPEMGAMNRLREEKGLCVSAKWRLAAAYKLAGQNEVAQKMIEKLPVSVVAYTELSDSYGSEKRDEAMILETLSLLGNRQKASSLAKSVAKTLSSEEWLSTQETAYSLLAMCEYANVKGQQAELNFTYSLHGKTQQVHSKKNLYQVKYTDKDFAGKGRMNFKNTGKSLLYVRVIVEGIPLAGDKSSSAKDLKMQLIFKDMQGMEIKPDKLTQGTDFVVEVTVTHPGKKGIYKEMTLNQIFPSGWEIHNTRMDGTGSSGPARYQDIRDDRVYSYFDLAPGTSKTFTIQLNATYRGNFYLPATYAEAMYDHLIHAKLPGKWVEVVEK